MTGNADGSRERQLGGWGKKTIGNNIFPPEFPSSQPLLPAFFFLGREGGDLNGTKQQHPKKNPPSLVLFFVRDFRAGSQGRSIPGRSRERKGKGVGIRDRGKPRRGGSSPKKFPKKNPPKFPEEAGSTPRLRAGHAASCCIPAGFWGRRAKLFLPWDSGSIPPGMRFRFREKRSGGDGGGWKSRDSSPERSLLEDRERDGKKKSLEKKRKKGREAEFLPALRGAGGSRAPWLAWRSG